MQHYLFLLSYLTSDLKTLGPVLSQIWCWWAFDIINWEWGSQWHGNEVKCQVKCIQNPCEFCIWIESLLCCCPWPLTCHDLTETRGRRGAGAYPSWHCVRGWIHPGQVTSSLLGWYLETNMHFFGLWGESRVSEGNPHRHMGEHTNATQRGSGPNRRATLSYILFGLHSRTVMQHSLGQH